MNSILSPICYEIFEVINAHQIVSNIFSANNKSHIKEEKAKDRLGIWEIKAKGALLQQL